MMATPKCNIGASILSPEAPMLHLKVTSVEKMFKSYIVGIIEIWKMMDISMRKIVILPVYDGDVSFQKSVFRESRTYVS